MHVVYYDNQSCIELSENPIFHDHSKNINIQYHYLEDRVQKGAIVFKYVLLNLQVANILTNPLAMG